MANLQHRPDRPRPWRVRWRDANGQPRSRSFRRRDDAVRFQHDVEHAADRGRRVDPNAGRTSFDHVAETWYAGKVAADRKPSTLYDYRSLLDVWVLPEFQGDPVGSIDYDRVAGFAAGLTRASLSATRRRRAIGIVAGILDLAVRDGQIPSNPARLVDLPPIPPRTRHRYLDHRQVHELAAATGDYRPLILTLAYTGLRWGEAVALRGTDVDRARGLIHVDRSATEAGGTLAYVAPKSHQRRDVPVPDLVLEALPETDGLLFTTGRSKPLRASNFRGGIWTPATRSCGLYGLRIHDLRHTAASLARAAGADAFVVARMLGHADASITAKVYADLFDVELEVLRRRMQASAEAALGHARATRERDPGVFGGTERDAV